MKKVTLLITALALVLGLSQCRKPNAPTINGGNGTTQHVTLTSSFGGDGSKLDVQTVSGSLNLKWEEGDKITILSPNSGELECTSMSADGKTGTFDGVITHNSGDITFTVGIEPEYLEQDGGAITEDDIYLVGTSEYKSDGKYENVPMELPYAILKLDLHGLVSSTGDVTITAAASAKGDAETVAKVLNVPTTPTDMYVMIPVAGTPAAKDYTFTGDAGSYTLKNKTLTSNTYFTAGGSGGTIVIAPESGPEGLCFTANAAGTISMMNAGGKKGIGEFGMGEVKDATAPDLQYSTDNGATWTVWSDLTTPIDVEKGDKFYIKAGETGNTSIFPYIFQTTGGFKVSGKIMYLLDNDLSPEPAMDQKCFLGLFMNSPDNNVYNSIIDASELQLPETTSTYCYGQMFYGCTSLTAAPALPAETLAENCYLAMFYGCTSLTAAPSLPAETLAEYCYMSMFYGCTSLTAAPALPAETLVGNCYASMFYGCTSLTTAPALPAEILATSCYRMMFVGCTSLTEAPELPATTLAEKCYYFMFSNCSNITSVTMLATDVSATYCLGWWLDGAGISATNPTVHVASDMKTTVKGTVPTNWTVEEISK